MNNGKLIFSNNEIEILNGKVVINQLESETEGMNISGDSITGSNFWEAYA